MDHSLRRHARRAVVPATIAVALLVAACGSSTSGAGGPTTTAASGPKLTGAPILLGNDGTYTEPGNSGYSTGKPAIEAWASWVNAHGGINGHPVKLFVMDDQNSQALALSNVETMVQQDHVIAFVSNQDGSLLSGYEQYLNDQKIPVLGGTVYTLDWVSNPMFFPQGVTAIEGETAAVTYAKKIGITKIGSIACSEAAQCALANGLLGSLAKANGLEDTYQAVASSTAPDYTANCLAAQAAGVQMLELLIPTADEGVKIADDCARQNYHPKWVIPGEAIAEGYLGTPSFNGAYNFSGTQPWFSTSSTMKDYNAAMKQYASGTNFNGAQEPQSAPDAWASGVMLQKAVELSGATGVPTSADVLAGLAKFDKQDLGGITGPLTFTDPTNKIANCFFVTEIQNQKFVQQNNNNYDCNPS